jgi:prevent-host-death family protein
MTVLTVSEARRKLAELMNLACFAGDRTVIERRGKRLAAVVSIADLELLQALEDRVDLDAARAALAEAGRKGTIAWKKLKVELGL